MRRTGPPSGSEFHCQGLTRSSELHRQRWTCRPGLLCQGLTRYSHLERKNSCRTIHCWPLTYLSTPHLRLDNRHWLASSDTPHGAGEEFPSPISAVESSGQRQIFPSVPALTRPLAPAALPAPEPSAAGVAALPHQVSPPTSRLEFPASFSPA